MTEQDVLKEYKRMAPTMNTLARSSRAQILYHILADAIYWSDEMPFPIEPLTENCLRLVLRYRTTLILGVPDAKWKPYWEEALRQFPNWIGFDQARRDPTLRDIVVQMRGEANSKSFWGARRRHRMQGPPDHEDRGWDG